MAKPSYKVPASLDASFLDMEIALQSDQGVGLKPLPVKVIMFWVFSALLFFYLCMNSFLSDAGAGWCILCGIFWVLLSILLGKHDASRRMGVQLVPVLLSYMQSGAKKILTRRTELAAPFEGLIGVDSIEEDGLVCHLDGTYTYWFQVVGSASVLLFDEDRTAILDRVAAFWQKIDVDVEIGFQTSKEPQRIHNQLVALADTYNALDFHSDDIDLLVMEQEDILRNFIGRAFKSVHQYMFIKGDNREALQAGVNVVASEVENSSLMFKRCIPMLKDDVLEFMASVYQQGNGGDDDGGQG